VKRWQWLALLGGGALAVGGAMLIAGGASAQPLPPPPPDPPAPPDSGPGQGSSDYVSQLKAWRDALIPAANRYRGFFYTWRELLSSEYHCPGPYDTATKVVEYIASLDEDMKLNPPNDQSLYATAQTIKRLMVSLYQASIAKVWRVGSGCAWGP
jgi:hypothetical protein